MLEWLTEAWFDVRQALTNPDMPVAGVLLPLDEWPQAASPTVVTAARDTNVMRCVLARG